MSRVICHVSHVMFAVLSVTNGNSHSHRPPPTNYLAMLSMLVQTEPIFYWFIKKTIIQMIWLPL